MHQPSLKEKSGAEMAPGWSCFHVHRMAPILVPFKYHFAKWYRFLKEKTAPLLKSGAFFQNSSMVEPFWLHFFFQWLQSNLW